MVDNTTLWTMLRAELTSQLGGDPSQFSGLQIVPVPFDALWDSPDYGEWLGFETGNNIPIWGPVYKASIGNWATDAYFAFLTNIDAPAQDPSAANQAQQLGLQMEAAQQKIKQARNQSISEWKKFNNSQKNRPPKDRIWHKEWFAKHWAVKMSVLQNNYDDLAAQWVAVADKAAGGYASLAQAVLDYNNPGFQVEAIDDNGASFSYRTWDLVPRLADFIKEAQAGQGSALNLQINTHTTTTNVTKWGVDASTGFNFGFVGIGTGGSLQRTAIDTTAQDFAMTFSVKAFTGIQITAGLWFHQNVVLQFQNGPFIANGPFGPGKAVFFGPTGTFNLMRSTMYVAYQPSITATVDTTAYSQVQQAWQAEAGLSIGPFSFNSGSGSKDSATFNDANRSFTFASNSPHPQVIAVNCNIMPNS